jgi:hypothetical protein
MYSAIVASQRNVIVGCMASLLIAVAGCSMSGGGAFVSRTAPSVETKQSACGVDGFYSLNGPCVAGFLPPVGKSFSLRKYRSITTTINISRNSGHGHATLAFAEATGEGDISPLHGKPFPLYPTPCAKAPCLGHAFLYFLDAESAVDIQKKSEIISSLRGFPGKSCNEAVLTDAGWIPLSFSVHPHRNTLVFSFVDETLFDPVTTIVAVFCQ